MLTEENGNQGKENELRDKEEVEISSTNYSSKFSSGTLRMYH